MTGLDIKIDSKLFSYFGSGTAGDPDVFATGVSINMSGLSMQDNATATGVFVDVTKPAGNNDGTRYAAIFMGGKVGIGTANPKEDLHVNGTIRANDLILTGRNDNTFRVGHEKLSPEELENFIKEKFNFEEVVISKIRDKILGWKPIAVIVKKENKEKIQLKNFVNKLQNNFSNYKIPKKIIFLKNLPTTQYGKLDRKRIEKKVNKINER